MNQVKQSGRSKGSHGKEVAQSLNVKSGRIAQQ